MSATEVNSPRRPRSLGALATLRAEQAYARLLLGLPLRLTGWPLAVGASQGIRSAPRLSLAPLAGVLAGQLAAQADRRHLRSANRAGGPANAMSVTSWRRSAPCAR